jgi:hypothetical protein
MSDDRFADYRRGIETGVMKSATPNAMLDCLKEIERLREARDADRKASLYWWRAYCEQRNLSHHVSCSEPEETACREALDAMDATATKIERLRAFIADSVHCPQILTGAGYHGRELYLEAEQVLRDSGD